MVEHSKSIRVLAYICAVILLPIYAIGPMILIYTIALRISDSDWLTILFLFGIFAVLSFWGFRCFYLMVRFLRTLKVTFTYDKTGITLMKGGNVNFYNWSSLKNSKGYKDCQIFCLIDENNRHLVSIWEYAKNYHEFRHETLANIGI
jgi:hypothetical protein